MRLYPTYSISGDGFRISRCLNCGAIFLGPKPTKKQLEQAYNDSYYGQGKSKFNGGIEKVLVFFRFSRARQVCRYVKAPAKVLDIGCGNGEFLAYLIKRGFQGYGVELPGKAAERAEQVKGLNLKIGQLSKEDFDEDFFDVVCMWHVFEHLTEPKATLQIIRKILKPGGYLMMSLPNIGSVQSRLFRGKWLHLDPPKHLFFLERSDLILEMNQLDFKLIKQKHFSLEQNVFGMQQSLLNCILKKREVLFEALKGNDDYVKEYSRCSIVLQKLFYIGSFPIFALLAFIEAILRKGGTMELIFRNYRP